MHVAHAFSQTSACILRCLSDWWAASAYGPAPASVVLVRLSPSASTGAKRARPHCTTKPGSPNGNTRPWESQAKVVARTLQSTRTPLTSLAIYCPLSHGRAPLLLSARSTTQPPSLILRVPSQMPRIRKLCIGSMRLLGHPWLQRSHDRLLGGRARFRDRSVSPCLRNARMRAFSRCRSPGVPADWPLQKPGRLRPRGQSEGRRPPRRSHAHEALQ
eukprot:scaffold322087_cov32-Tisochrysis_lutea.AAC.2